MRLPAIRWSLAALLSVCLPVLAKDDSLPDFSSLSLEELSNIKVTSVSKKQEKLSQVAAAVYVISQEEIHRSGMTNIADVLRMVPGLSVARIDGSKWAVTSRGFNSRFANKLLVLVDGRSIYTPIFGGVYWDMSMPPLDTIERIEVIRGPGAAVWGANAVSGVINIITKSASEMRGVEVTSSAGSEERGEMEVQGGGKMGQTSYRAYFDGTDRSALQTSDGGDGRDGWWDVQGGFRMDGTTHNGGWLLEGDLFHNSRDESSAIPTPANQFSSATQYATEPGNSGSLAFEWRRLVGDNGELKLSTSYDYSNRPELGYEEGRANSGDVELQYHFTVGKYHDISLGLGDRVIAETVLGEGMADFSPPNMNYQTASGFAQDEIHLLDDRVLLTAGVKIEHDVLSGWQAEPTARALWAPNTRHSVWVSASRAVRTPTFYDLALQITGEEIPGSPATLNLPVVPTLAGAPAFKPEIAKDYELGYRAQLSAKFSLDLAGFYTHFDDYLTTSPGSPSLVPGADPYIVTPYAFTNFGSGHAEGVEAAITYHPVTCWKVAASYSYLNPDADVVPTAAAGTEALLSATPAHQVKVQSYWNISKSLELDTHVYYWSSFLAPNQAILTSLIPSHVRVDVRLGWRVKPRWELSFVGQDLGSSQTLEMTPDSETPVRYTSRGFYVKSSVRF